MVLEVKFDPEQKGLLFGKKGSTIRQIQEESNGALLDVDKGSDCTVRITGPARAVQKARHALAELLHLDAARVETVEVPAELMDVIFGSRGERMRRVEATHGVSTARLDGEQTSVTGVRVRGSVEGVAAAVN